MGDRDEEVGRLAALHWAMVSTDHHKDADGHWWIAAKWSYGGRAPRYEVEHYGYCYEGVEENSFATYAQAEAHLIEHLRKAIAEEVDWAKSCDGDDWCRMRAATILKMARDAGWEGV